MGTHTKSSPPTSPSEKKVCFADLVGHKLELIKFITPSNSDVNVSSVGACKKNTCTFVVRGTSESEKYLYPCFVQPFITDNFLQRVYNQNVCLESIACINFVVTGIIRVTNLSWMKTVSVRFTLDDWATHKDVRADYLSSCCDGKTDKFSFRIAVPMDFETNQKMEFAICYCVTKLEFWDNNSRFNYQIQCLKVFAD